MAKWLPKFFGLAIRGRKKLTEVLPGGTLMDGWLGDFPHLRGCFVAMPRVCYGRSKRNKMGESKISMNLGESFFKRFTSNPDEIQIYEFPTFGISWKFTWNGGVQELWTLNFYIITSNISYMTDLQRYPIDFWWHQRQRFWVGYFRWVGWLTSSVEDLDLRYGYQVNKVVVDQGRVAVHAIGRTVEWADAVLSAEFSPISQDGWWNLCFCFFFLLRFGRRYLQERRLYFWKLWGIT